MNNVASNIVSRLEQRDEGTLCCHIAGADVFSVSESLANQLRMRGHTAGLASCFTIQARRFDRFIPQSTASWFSKVAHCSRQTAEEIIAQLPVPVNERLAYNAANPRCAVAVAAKAYSQPDFVIYTTSGMDPLGIQALQRGIHMLCSGTRAVHICNAMNANRKEWPCAAQPPMECVHIKA